MSADLTDFWLQPWSEPVRRRPTPVPASAPFYTGEAAREDVPIMSRWFAPLSEPVRRRASAFPHAQQVTTSNPFGMTLPESVHLQWMTPWSVPVPPRQFRTSLQLAAVLARVPLSVAGVTFTPAPGSFLYSGGRAFFEGQPGDQPPFFWDQSYVVPIASPPIGGEIADATIDFIAYDPFNSILWVQFENGIARTYAPVTTGQVQAISFSSDPAALVATLPLAS